MKKIVLIWFLGCFSLLAQVQKSQTTTLMGCRFDITIVEKDSALAKQRIAEVIYEIERIENEISEWRPHTLVSKVNQNAGIAPVKVSEELMQLTKNGIYFSKITQGAFDISIAAMDKIWHFDGSMTKMPSEIAIKKSIENVGFQNIQLDQTNETIFLKKKGMKIGFGSIGKGYAADKARALMESKGVLGGIINASGDLTTWGKQANGKAWRIGVVNPFDTSDYVEVLEFNRQAVVTSGSYEKFAKIGKKRYSHIIDPKTGYPSSGVCSVTVVGPNAEMANGLSTSIMVLGIKKGLKLLRDFPEYACLIITDSGKKYYSKHFKDSEKQ